MKSASLKILVLCACLLIANGFLQWLVDSDMGVCWTHNVIRNWQEYGVTTLQGKLVQNPGGHDALTQPDIYPGHRPNSLYPAYFIGKLFAWTGSYALPYHFFSTLAFLAGTYYLLGGTLRALFLGGAAILTPGYLIEPTILDPNAVAILSGIPYAALLWWQLSLPKLRAGNVIFLALVTFVFTSLNWTTAFIHGQIFLTLLICRAVPISRLIYYVVIGAGSAVLVVAIGVMAKLTEHGQQPSGALGNMISSYMWGGGGYSDGSGTMDLLVRLAFINILGLLPLWLLLAWNWLRRFKLGRLHAMSSLAPLLLALFETLVMRNYFSHHPWMAAPLLLVGWIFSIKILESPGHSPSLKNWIPDVSQPWHPVWSAGLVLAFGFGFGVLLINKVHASRLYSLISLVRHGTARGDQIIVVENRDPQLVTFANRLAENLDRQVGLVEILPMAQTFDTGALLLSAVPMGEGWHESGHTQAAESIPMVNRMLAWFTSHISKRKPGDKMELADTYYMYFVNPPLKFTVPLPENAGKPATRATP